MHYALYLVESTNHPLLATSKFDNKMRDEKRGPYGQRMGGLPRMANRGFCFYVLYNVCGADSWSEHRTKGFATANPVFQAFHFNMNRGLHLLKGSYIPSGY